MKTLDLLKGVQVVFAKKVFLLLVLVLFAVSLLADVDFSLKYHGQTQSKSSLFDEHAPEDEGAFSIFYEKEFELLKNLYINFENDFSLNSQKEDLESESYENKLKYLGDYFIGTIGQNSLVFGNSENWELDGYYKEKIDRNPVGLWMVSAEFLGECLGANAFYIPKTDWQDRPSVVGVLLSMNTQELDFRLVPSCQVEGDKLWKSNFSFSYSHEKIENLILAVDGLLYEHKGDLQIAKVPNYPKYYTQESGERKVYAAVNSMLKYTFPNNWTTMLSYFYNQRGMNRSEYKRFLDRLDDRATFGSLLPAIYSDNEDFGLYRHYLGFFVERPLIADKFDIHLEGKINLYDTSWICYGSLDYSINDKLKLGNNLIYASGTESDSEFAQYFFDLDYSLELSYMF